MENAGSHLVQDQKNMKKNIHSAEVSSLGIKVTSKAAEEGVLGKRKAVNDDISKAAEEGELGKRKALKDDDISKLGKHSPHEEASKSCNPVYVEDLVEDLPEDIYDHDHEICIKERRRSGNYRYPACLEVELIEDYPYPIPIPKDSRPVDEEFLVDEEFWDPVRACEDLCKAFEMIESEDSENENSD